MTAAHHGARLLSLDEWRALDEDTETRSELQEGVLVVSPRPLKPHARVIARLITQLAAQLPDSVEALPEVEVIVDASPPPTVRIPDVIICPTTPDTTVDASQVLLAVEVMSPGSRRTDQITKRSEYADAGIGHYWIIDRERRIMTALELTSDGYVGSEHSGMFETSRPCALRIDIDALDI
ncbi:Uma2 family endonuclease [Gordonia pseudamarae]|jgi:Uma2 family endonuclease|uniref:Uma2 family endonuclease n=1 Tax=Gordonia pseudamarae TaxID=2831662 RepID=A0ABX6IGJ9_9ACTN|nr:MULTISPECIES: Uma2 family endonuclease [Gordonia]MBD0023500.1 Uma2 family endonuclease [Gordonia sp. (in: high G+C Gram-positive bacteria)]QHN26052.1 Uma2 family endonuclease [Gordonia pseudamarae]QHN34977.1 Uma2 family endonuclease [Gordonia pseudamarae]